MLNSRHVEQDPLLDRNKIDLDLATRHQQAGDADGGARRR
jgi:hypothetical protein